MKKELIEVGDIFYSLSYGTVNGRYVVERVTNTTAISGDYKFRRPIKDNGWLDQIGRPSFSPKSFYLETAELKEKYEINKTINKISNFNFRVLDYHRLMKVVHIIDQFKKENPAI